MHLQRFVILLWAVVVPITSGSFYLGSSFFCLTHCGPTNGTLRHQWPVHWNSCWCCLLPGWLCYIIENMARIRHFTNTGFWTKISHILFDICLYRYKHIALTSATYLSYNSFAQMAVWNTMLSTIKCLQNSTKNTKEKIRHSVKAFVFINLIVINGCTSTTVVVAS